MNIERRDPREVLLDDVFVTAEIERGAGKEAALTAFRRGRALRRVNRILAATIVAAVICALAAYLPHLREKGRGEIAKQNVPLATPTQAAAPPPLSDQELVGSFPPNTCLIAEVDGRKVLVFVDAAARRKCLAEEQLHASLR